MSKKIKILPSSLGYNLVAPLYDKKEKYLNSFEKGQLLSLLGDVSGKKVLDVGAGTGRLSIPLAKQGALVTALDASEEMLEVLKRKAGGLVCHSECSGLRVPSTTFSRSSSGGLGLASVGMTSRGCVGVVVGDAANLLFQNNTFDLSVAAFLIVHLKDPTSFFDEAYRVLKDGGLFLVTNINQKEPPEVETPEGKIKIESYYHRPEKVREILEYLAFSIEKEIFVNEGEKRVNQILVARK